MLLVEAILQCLWICTRKSDRILAKGSFLVEWQLHLVEVWAALLLP